MFKIDRPYNIGLGYAQHVTIRSMIPRPKSIKSKGKLIILGARKKIWGAGPIGHDATGQYLPLVFSLM